MFPRFIKLLRSFAGKRFDHASILSCHVTLVNKRPWVLTRKEERGCLDILKLKQFVGQFYLGNSVPCLLSVRAMWALKSLLEPVSHIFNSMASG